MRLSTSHVVTEMPISRPCGNLSKAHGRFSRASIISLSLSLSFLFSCIPFLPNECSRIAAIRTIVRIKGTMEHARILRPWSHAAIGRNQRKPTVIGCFVENQPLDRPCTTVRVYHGIWRQNSATHRERERERERGTSSRTLHRRPCQAIDRRFRPLASAFLCHRTIQQTACRVPSESNLSLSFRASSNSGLWNSVAVKHSRMRARMRTPMKWVTSMQRGWNGCKGKEISLVFGVDFVFWMEIRLMRG